jgi:hypothetical protein
MKMLIVNFRFILSDCQGKMSNIIQGNIIPNIADKLLNCIQKLPYRPTGA